MSELQTILDSMPLPEGEFVKGGDHRARGWQYRDIPGKLSPEAWDELICAIGLGEFELLAFSSGTFKDGTPWKRGQLIISPKGFENMAAYVKAKRAEGNTEKSKDHSSPSSPLSEER